MTKPLHIQLIIDISSQIFFTESIITITDGGETINGYMNNLSRRRVLENVEIKCKRHSAKTQPFIRMIIITITEMRAVDPACVTETVSPTSVMISIQTRCSCE